ncbi:MAG: hypothetical protein JSV20_07500 [Candidatus Bathyarchaeota archaeon]|nr:MAG: hypothetical protein JSV20_07500 [Candidatus Bathyarchaeota archaeon]
MSNEVACRIDVDVHTVAGYFIEGLPQIVVAALYNACDTSNVYDVHFSIAPGALLSLAFS